MPSFRPTPPPGRLARLGVLLDTRNGPTRLRELARMCERAGADALWVRDWLTPINGHRLEAWTCLTMAGLDTSRVRVGGILDTGLRPPETLAAMVATLNLALGGRLEITLAGGCVEDYARTVRERLAEVEPPPLSVEATDAAGIGVAVRVADAVLIPAAAGRSRAALLEAVRATCEHAARDPSSLGIAVELPVSIGRTAAEAEARAHAEPLFRGTDHPSRVGIFGTLEECQDRVIQLAHAGVTDLRCILPNTADVPDVIAQLTAAVVGTPDVLRPGAPRSRAPDPPDGWGARRAR